MHDYNKLSDEELKAAIEDIRSKLKPNKQKGAVLIILIIVVGAMSAYTLNTLKYSYYYPIIATVLIALCLIMFAVGWFVMSKAEKQSKTITKLIDQSILSPILPEFFDVESINKFSHIAKAEIKSTKLVEKWNKIIGTDHIIGRYKSVNFESCDLRLILSKTSGDESARTYERTQFSGQWIICHTQEHIPEKLTIKERRIHSPHEALPFDMRYEVKSKSGDTERILTTSFMQSLIELSAKIEKQIFLHFEGNKVHILVHNHIDLFSVNAEEKEFEEIAMIRERYRAEAQFLADIIDGVTSHCSLF